MNLGDVVSVIGKLVGIRLTDENEKVCDVRIVTEDGEDVVYSIPVGKIIIKEG